MVCSDDAPPRPGSSAGGHDITVYVLDDHDHVRASLVETLDAAAGITVVGTGATVRAACQDIPRLRPDVALLDGVLPDGTGVDVCRTLATTAPDVACVILTAATTTDGGLAAAAAAGAAAYLVKTLHDLPLVDTIRDVAARHRRRAGGGAGAT